jgi:DNA-binding beta-propeller fold protein YncE
MEKTNSTLVRTPLKIKQNGGLNRKLEKFQHQRSATTIVSTVAGDGTAGFLDGPALTAKFKFPLDVAILPNGVIYVADAFNSCIRKIENGIVTTFAGNGNANITNGNSSEARFKIPNRLALDIEGNLYLLDAADPRIRKITRAADVYTYAGTNVFGFKDGESIVAQFGQSFGIVADKHGNIYIADSQNDSVRKISFKGEITTIAGGAVKHFQFVTGIAVNKQGDLFVSDICRIKKITPAGIVSTFAGGYQKGYIDGRGRGAMFSQIESMAMDQKENIYVTDENLIRKITPQGTVYTIAGSEAGYRDGNGASAMFDGPQGLCVDQQGNIYVADSNSKRIRKISFE